MDHAVPKKVRCRAIADSDVDAVASLLCEGFPGRTRSHWLNGLARMRDRDVPAGHQRFGYALDAGGQIVGVILLICATRPTGDGQVPFTNAASWYVAPEFRTYANLLVSIAMRNKDTTYLNVSAAPHTWPIVEQQGYARYCEGLFFAAAPLTVPVRGVSVEELNEGHLSALASYDMLVRHRDYGCTVLVCRQGPVFTPFVFRRYAIRSGRVPLPAVQVIYASDEKELVRLAGNLGRFLLRRGTPVVVMDANGPVEGLRGVFTARRGRKYYKGPHRPALCDLADTEFAIFGV
ncbi:hypothetical protein BH10PSE7_BH10PSE7_14140 [soil metagenome]